ncbi:response regulator [Candidatus Nitrosocosmicus franklandus]|uniref:Sensor histidine kinase RcsC n=1 Tax=Candidatus Nitrosocosmicus franklandianus TaxID=1798806 RepID=A0A484I9H7_9ARCH|nr:response regulator [Candidatus Nitrosocosmicus franklandus]VFJ14380.1 Sensor histidine kinase RcsC [Candidatus Nitrosocosmicus franklandus]
MNLLAIDDSSDTLEAISDYCNIEGVKCKVASEGLQGLLEIQKQEYDLILLDMAIPEYSGFDILDQLKKQGVREKNLVVITAAKLDMDNFSDYKEVGIKEVLHKPISLDQLDELIDKYSKARKGAHISSV